MRKRHGLLVSLLLLLAAIGAAQAVKQPLDEDFARAVKEWTTKPEFVSPLVDHLPKGGAIPINEQKGTTG